MKPPLAYFGAKVTVAEAIVSVFPEHDGYIEPYGGSLAVLLAKPIERMEVVNDKSQDLMTFWRVLRDRTEELINVCQLTPHSRGEMELAKERGPEVDDLERARRVWVRLTQGRTGTLRNTGWRFYLDPHATSSAFSRYMEAYKARLAPVAERLMNVSLECRDAIDVVRAYGVFGYNLLYIDPPYLNRTRSSLGYEHEAGDEEHHIELLTELQKIPAAVVLSGYDDPLYDSMLGGWFKQSLRSRSQLGRETTEVLWSNRDTPHTLFDFEVERDAS
jgi:DNA adenine methylase